MLSLLEQIDNGTLWQSPGGIHPPQLKSLSNITTISRLPLAKEYIVPMPQLGEQAILAVNVGEHVNKGTVLTQGHSATYLAVHSPTSGTLVAVEERASNHASGLPVLSCIIQADGLDTWRERDPLPHYHSIPNDEILTRIKEAGIAGLGGAAFPTHIKLNPVSDIELLIINGIECEPYITSDDRLMREYSHDILTGIGIIQKLVEPKRIIIAIEDNKPEAINAIENALKKHPINHPHIRITAVPTKYPSGGEKQLIQILTGQEVPSGAIPAQLGMLVQNVGTAFAIKEAIIDDKPLIERVVTLTGEQASNPGNYWLPVGTPIDHILTLGQKGSPSQPIIIGGPMMGYMLPKIEAPIIKGTNCLLLPSPTEMQTEQQEKPCIRCGECAQVCPALLLPQQLFWHAQAEEYEKAASYNLQDCIECGCCSYVCPSDIPLVEYYRVAKSALREQAKDKQEADLAKERFDARTQRLEAEKAAREAKQQQAASRRKANMSNKDSDVIAAAMARVKAKQSEDNPTVQQVSQNAPVNSTDKKAQIAAALARAKAKKAQANQSNSQAEPAEVDAVQSNEPDSQASDKKAQIAAAIARAKAKKAQTNKSDSEIAPVDTNAPQSNRSASPLSNKPAIDKKAQIAAAIARAKAKKAQANQSNSQTEPAEVDAVQSNEADSQASDKQAQIAAAIARAKAKKAQTNKSDSQTESAEADAAQSNELKSNEPESPLSTEHTNDKKAQIAAAIARAKAKKAQANRSNSQTEPVEADAAQSNELKSNEPASSLSTEHINDKQAKIAAAIARAKAKKAQANRSNSQTEPVEADAAQSNELKSNEPASLSTEPANDRKAKIAAAVAKAKAKKAQSTLLNQQETQNDVTQTDNEPPQAIPSSATESLRRSVSVSNGARLDSTVIDKKARIAAAIAKAKAKKAQAQQENKD
ncbi:electron transport complex subunit RsxC [uncultured Shewanella sp.]|uniref:electron transport complex subunit RsxC n=1 Tax=uncultured Shewanella sp. TaxID=173975 RepID=UPI002609F13B|nr:electron transport complex subunit RsxC [uncultured Shewanella sp.]